MYKCAPFRITRQPHNWVVKDCHIKTMGPQTKSLENTDLNVPYVNGFQVHLPCEVKYHYKQKH